MSYKTVNLKIDVAARARRVADARNLPLAALLAELINTAYADQFGAEEATNVAFADGTIALKLFSTTAPPIDIPMNHAASFADMLLKIALGYGDATALDLDSPAVPSVSRRGAAVVLEALDRAGQQTRRTMSVHEAKNLAAEIRGFLK